MSLDKFVGNRQAIERVRKIIESDSLPNVILFIGPPGTGKTSLARVLADHFADSKLSIIEYNSAVYSGVDTARQIAKLSETPPMTGSFRVYIFDEVHRASPQFLDVLLKPMEESKYSRFILCTTDATFPSKYPTVASRAVIIETKMLSLQETKELLTKKLGKAGSRSEVVETVYQLTHGTPRDILLICREISQYNSVAEALNAISSRYALKRAGSIREFAKHLLSASTSDESFDDSFRRVVDKIVANPEEVRRAIVSKLQNAILKCMLSPSELSNDMAVKVLQELSSPWYEPLQAFKSIFAIRSLIKRMKG